MAIDLFCYVSTPVAEVQAKLDLMVSTHKGLFSQRFLISEVYEVSKEQNEFAMEYKLHASCKFLIRLNDKSSSDLLKTVEEITKNTLGSENVIILF